jgi:hypothetical protein
MDNRLIFLYRFTGAMEGRSMLSDPAIGSAGRRLQGDWQENPPVIKPEGRKDWKSSDNRDSLILCCQEKLLSVEGKASVP